MLLEQANNCRILTIKAAFIVAFFASFFLQADDNIFTNGTIDLEQPIITPVTEFHCNFGSNESYYTQGSSDINELSHLCAIELQDDWMSVDNPYGEVPGCSFSTSIIIVNTYYTIVNKRTCSQEISNWEKSHSVQATFLSNTQTYECPPVSHPTFVSLTNQTQSPSCYNPDQANLLDSCNASSGNSVLNKQVTESVGCFTQSDGSICKYNAVDVGSGNQVYQMDLEGDCYTEPEPDLNANTDLGNTPTNQDCTDIGNGVLACPADPENVCNSDGSSYGGGSINNCQSGCGYVNDQFLCYDNDTDIDGIPDYNDPDIDGDGIPNGQDLDSDGDGQDDPIDSGTGTGGSGGGTTNINVDMGPVVAAVKKVEDKLTYTSTTQVADKTKFNELFGAAQTATLEAEIAQLKTDVRAELAAMRAEASTMMSITATSTGYQVRNLTLTQGTFDMSLTRFSDFFKLLAGPIMLICSLIAAIVLLGGKD